MTRVLAAALMAAAALQDPASRWPQFRAEPLGISFRHPATPGLRFETRAATCADRTWQGGVPDSMVVVSRTASRVEQVAAFLGIIRDGAGWVAEGYQGARAPVAEVRVGGWLALVAPQAVTVVYDMALQSPVAASQWRFVAFGPSPDGCHPLIVAVATGLPAAWDSSAVGAILRSARPRVP